MSLLVVRSVVACRRLSHPLSRMIGMIRSIVQKGGFQFIPMAILGAFLLGACASAAHPSPTPTVETRPASADILATIRGIAARCAGPPSVEGLAVRVEVYKQGHGHKVLVKTVTTSLKRGDRYRIRIRPGRYLVIARGAGDPGKWITLRSGEIRTVDFPNYCLITN
jgi:hypothetical protein